MAGVYSRDDIVNWASQLDSDIERTTGLEIIDALYPLMEAINTYEARAVTNQTIEVFYPGSSLGQGNVAYLCEQLRAVGRMFDQQTVQLTPVVQPSEIRLGL